jgi:hypothetical protein
MITKEDIERKRAYIESLEPNVERSAALQVLDDLERVVGRIEYAANGPSLRAAMDVVKDPRSEDPSGCYRVGYEAAIRRIKG